MKILIDFILHLDKHILEVVEKTGNISYIILFLIIFAETGFVITPFLPGDSLLFATGAITAAGAKLNIILLYVLLCSAAILGDSINYSIGKFIGPKAFTMDSKFLKKEYLEKSKRFYEKHGGKAIFLSRFIPIIRTFAPFVAGASLMNYKKFVFFNITGGITWISIFLFLGYFFGNINFIKENFHYSIFLIIFISLIPVIVEFIKSKRDNRQNK